eukprot:6986206-Prymnesium_polylepis.2
MKRGAQPRAPASCSSWCGAWGEDLGRTRSQGFACESVRTEIENAERRRRGETGRERGARRTTTSPTDQESMRVPPVPNEAFTVQQYIWTQTLIRLRSSEVRTGISRWVTLTQGEYKAQPDAASSPSGLSP